MRVIKILVIAVCILSLPSVSSAAVLYAQVGNVSLASSTATNVGYQSLGTGLTGYVESVSTLVYLAGPATTTTRFEIHLLQNTTNTTVGATGVADTVFPHALVPTSTPLGSYRIYLNEGTDSDLEFPGILFDSSKYYFIAISPLLNAAEPGVSNISYSWTAVASS